MSYRIYIAGDSSERLTVVRPLMEKVRGFGYTITRDWTYDEGYDRNKTHDEHVVSAHLDLNGVRSADVIWLVKPAEKSEGSATELGVALALGKPVIVSGERKHGNLFARLATHAFERHDEALDCLQRREWL